MKCNRSHQDDKYSTLTGEDKTNYEAACTLTYTITQVTMFPEKIYCHRLNIHML